MNTENISQPSEQTPTYKGTKLSEVTFPQIIEYLQTSEKLYSTLNIPINDAVWNEEDKTVSLEMVVPDVFQAYDGSAHGGLTGLLVDSIGGLSIVMEGCKVDKKAVTVDLHINGYRKPLKIGSSILVVGKVVTDIRRIVKASCEIIDRDTNEVICTGEVTMLLKTEAN